MFPHSRVPCSCQYGNCRCTRQTFKEFLMNTVEQQWPTLPLEEWEPTYKTLHMWTQIVGKIRLALTPLVNHWWNTALYVNTRGLTTSPIPYRGGAFEIQFDFVQHRLEL